ncbi:hypothetical protein DYQ93_02465 [Xanthomonas sp. LMG 8992]|nr:hypothetical protein [Xanthomonas sp. LMG 8992]
MKDAPGAMRRHAQRQWRRAAEVAVAVSAAFREGALACATQGLDGWPPELSSSEIAACAPPWVSLSAMSAAMRDGSFVARQVVLA